MLVTRLMTFSRREYPLDRAVISSLILLADHSSVADVPRSLMTR